jgi:hypothetical protein
VKHACKIIENLLEFEFSTGEICCPQVNEIEAVLAVNHRKGVGAFAGLSLGRSHVSGV